MARLAERIVDTHGITDQPARPGRRSATVNLAESPLSWLRSRGLLDDRQYDAGERLRADYERAALSPSVTMRWDGMSHSRHAAPAAIDPATAQISAKQRFDAALAAVGRGLADIVWRVVCACEGTPAAEKALGWPSRSGRLVLTIALDRLADHYRLP